MRINSGVGDGVDDEVDDGMDDEIDDGVDDSSRSMRLCIYHTYTCPCILSIYFTQQPYLYVLIQWLQHHIIFNRRRTSSRSNIFSVA